MPMAEVLFSSPARPVCSGFSVCFVCVSAYVCVCLCVCVCVCVCMCVCVCVGVSVGVVKSVRVSVCGQVSVGKCVWPLPELR